MKSTAPFLAFVAGCLGSAPAAFAQEGTSGQAFAFVDPIGVPMALLETPTLQPGVQYEFETTDLQPHPASAFADTVMSLRSSGQVTATTLAGADGCGSLFEPSCFKWTLPAGSQPGTRWLVVRAWQTTTAGTCDIRYRPVGTGTWTTLADNISFGGIVVSGASLGTSRTGTIRVETTQQHGQNPTLPVVAAHFILFAASNDNINTNWTYAPNAPAGTPLPLPGTPETHHRLIRGTSEWFGTGSSVYLSAIDGLVVAGAFSAYAAGPLRLLRNDWVGGANRDTDGDQLGSDLEVVLKTCDSTSSPPAGGLFCVSRPGCGSPTSAACRESMRDSDEDGLRDDIELYGHTTNNLELARFGAAPAHYDVFVDVDRFGQGTPCVSDTPPVPTTYTAAHDAYRQLPNTHFRNRDGTNGIFAHFDVGYGPSVGAPRADFMKYGPWGGGGQCLVAGSDTYDNGVATSRRWVFRWAIAIMSGGQSNAVLSLGSSFDSAATLVHELGHQAGLDHYGPRWGGDWFQGKPHYWSRMSYTYAYVGGAGLTDPDTSRVMFSTGMFGAFELNPTAVAEQCPLGTSSDLSLLDDYHLLHQGRVSAGAGCQNVDWDHDGTASTGTVRAPMLDFQTHIARMTDRSGGASEVNFDATSTGGDLAIWNNERLLWFKVIPITGGANRLEVHENVSLACSSTPVGVPDVVDNDFPPCWSLEPAWRMWASPTAYVNPTAVTAERATFSGSVPGVVVVYVESGVLRYTRLKRVLGVWENTASQSVPTGITLNVDPARHMPALRRFGSNLLLMYANSAGTIYEQTYDPIADSWGTASAATATGGAPLTALEGSPTLGYTSTTAYGAGLVLTAPTEEEVCLPPPVFCIMQDRIQLWSRAVGATTWTSRGVLSNAVGRRAFVVETPDGASARLTAFWLEGNTDWYAETGRASYGFGDRGRLAADDAFAMNPPVAIWDARPGTVPGVRFVMSHARVFNTSSCLRPDGLPACSSANPTCTEFVADAYWCSNSTGLGRQGYEFLAPFGDGRFPGLLRDHDDHPQMRWGFCSTIRGSVQQSFAPAGFAETAGSCGTEPFAD